MQEVVTRPLLLLALNEVAYASEAVTKQLRALSEFTVENFYPPLPAGQEPVGMPAGVHVATVVATFFATLESDMEGARAGSLRSVPLRYRDATSSRCCRSGRLRPSSSGG